MGYINAATLNETLKAIHTLRNEVPQFNPDDAESKEKIEHFHTAIHNLILSVKNEVGFDTVEQTLKFIDLELLNMARIGEAV